MNDELKQLRETLDEHLRQCAATNAEVALKLKGIIWILSVIGGALIVDIVQRLG